MADHSGFKLLSEINLNYKTVYNLGSICVADRSSAYSVPSGSWTQIPLNREIYDPQNWHSLTTNTERITVPSAGYYLVFAFGRFADNTTGFRGLAIFRNGSGYHPTGNLGLTAFGGLDSGGRWSKSIIWFFSLAANDYISVAVNQTSGANLNLDYIMLGVIRF